MGCIEPNCMYWNTYQKRCSLFERRPKTHDCKMAHPISGAMNTERPKYGY